LQLSSTNDYVQTEPLNYTGNRFSITAWIKPDSIQAQYTGIVTHANTAIPAGLMLNNQNELMFQWLGAQWSWHSGLFVPVDTWSHVALVIQPNKAVLYLNGDSSIFNAAMLPIQWSDGLVIGRYANWNSRNFTGHIEEVCIWDTCLTQTQIRAEMHLTKYEQQASSLIHYYQFNALGPLVLDRKSSLHAEFRGGASRVSSTAPVGGGSSQSIWVDSAGPYNFERAFLSLYFKDSLLPNGIIVANRLNVPPDVIPNSYLYSNGYWILNHYGSNAVFNLDSIVLQSPVTTSNVSSGSVYLKHRFVRGASNTWQANFDTAKTINNQQFIVEGPWMTRRIGQMALLSDSMPVWLNSGSSTLLVPQELRLFPNPSLGNQQIHLIVPEAAAYTFELFNIKGQKLQEFSFVGQKASFSLLQEGAGNFFYRLRSDRTMYHGVLQRLAP
jgi:hypothetical protein